MMERELFRGVVPFVAVAEALSFRRAAARLGVTAAAVSKAVQALEAEVGATLLQRTSRAVSLTHEGEVFLARCQGAMAQVAGGREELSGSSRGPQGQAVVSAPFALAPLVVTALALLRLRYPRLTVRLAVTDQLSRLAAEGVDVAVRMGKVDDESLIARPLGKTRWTTLASPSYLARRGRPEFVLDLERHECVVFVGPDGRDRDWLFVDGALKVPAALRLDHGPSLLDAARAGLGIVQVLGFMAAHDVTAARLVPVLESVSADGPALSALCTARRRASANVKAIVQALGESFAEPLSVPRRGLTR
jgi:LysR family transcriptional regulator, regulator for bpeEF and oprC